MKKSMTAVAACLIAGMVSAQIESQNIVGYTTSVIDSATWYQMASTFVPVLGTANDGKAINDVFTTGFEAGDKLYVWNQEQQKYDPYVWMTAPLDENFEPTVAGWADDTEMRTAAILKIGQSVFMRKLSAGSTSVTFSGQVEVDLSTTIPSATWVQVSLPYPVSVALNDEITWTGFAAGDKVFVWNTAQQKYDPYIWMTAPLDENFEPTVAGWADDTEMRTLVKLPLGAPMFIYKVTAGSGSFAKAN